MQLSSFPQFVDSSSTLIIFRVPQYKYDILSVLLTKLASKYNCLLLQMSQKTSRKSQNPTIIVISDDKEKVCGSKSQSDNSLSPVCPGHMVFLSQINPDYKHIEPLHLAVELIETCLRPFMA